jgi:hypothetical protein
MDCVPRAVASDTCQECNFLYARTFISVRSVPVVCVNTTGKTQIFVYCTTVNTTAVNLYYNVICQTIYLGHIEAFIRGGEHLLYVTLLAPGV